MRETEGAEVVTAADDAVKALCVQRSIDRCRTYIHPLSVVILTLSPSCHRFAAVARLDIMVVQIVDASVCLNNLNSARKRFAANTSICPLHMVK